MKLSAEHLAAYEQARYVIDYGAGITVRVGPNVLPPAFASLLGDRYGVLLTAWNPHSVDQPLNVNRALNTELGNRMRAEGRAFVTAFGADDAATWREDGFFVYPLTLKQAAQACVVLRQNAVVAVNANGEATLVFHPDLDLARS